MAVEGIHYLALGSAKARYAKVVEEFNQAKQQLAEAVAMGDLRENEEYETSKVIVGKLARELDALSPVMSMNAVRSNDSVLVIQEGCVIDLIIHQLTESPVTPGTAEFEKLKEGTPAFRGLLSFGASMPFHELLTDNILSIETEVGMFLLGKQPGDYSVEVAGGFSNLSVEKIYGIEEPVSLYCEIGGERHVEQRG